MEERECRVMETLKRSSKKQYEQVLFIPNWGTVSNRLTKIILDHNSSLKRVTGW